MGVSPMQAPDTPTNVTIHFEKGVPTMVDGVAMNCTEVIKKLNEVGGANGAEFWTSWKTVWSA